MINKRETEILEFVKKNGASSSKEINDGIKSSISYATVKRILTKLTADHLLDIHGKGKATKYLIAPSYELLYPLDILEYFSKEVDEREIKERFNFDLLKETLIHTNIFIESETQKLNLLLHRYQKNVSLLSKADYNKELERFAIDLSWKSSQIEGNTYTLLETERLLKQKETASGKTKEEANMLLNHKDAIDFIIDHPHYLHPLKISAIEDVHSILVKELNIEKNIRKRRVGITGTNYRPLDNEFQIKEAMISMCDLINTKENIFEKALLALVLISYIQPFSDGNKRTARMISNAILMHFKYCPISFRTVDSVHYKKAMLLFYEQNNISAIKNIFIDQYDFAVNTYF